MKIQESSDVFPYDFVGENYCITNNGYAVFGLKINKCEAFTLSEEGDQKDDNFEVRKLFNEWKVSLKLLKSDSIVQKYVFVNNIPYTAEELNGSLTDRWNKDSWTQRDVLTEDTYVVVSIPITKSLVNKQSLFKRVSNYEGSNMKIGEASMQFEDFFRSCSQGAFNSAYRLNGKELVDLVFRVWNIDSENVDVLSDVAWSKDTFKVGGDDLAVLTSRRLPDIFDGWSSSRGITASSELVDNKTMVYNETKLPCSFLFPLGIGFPTKHILIETYELLDFEKVESNLMKEDLALKRVTGLFNRAEATAARRSIAELINLRSENGNYTYANWGVTVLMHGTSHDSANELGKRASLVAKKSLSLQLEQENFDAFGSYYASLPGMGKKCNNLRLGFLEVYAYMTHLESFKEGNSDGVILIDMFGKPFKQSLWKSKYTEAANGILFGPTGQGKSFTVNHILDSAYQDGDEIFVIDVGGSFKRTCEINNGVYFDSNNLSNLSFAPFKECYEKEGKYYPKLDISRRSENLTGITEEKSAFFIEFLKTLITSIWFADREYPNELNNILYKVITSFYEKYNKGEEIEISLNGFVKYVLTMHQFDDNSSKYFDKGSFEIAMENWVGDGMYSNIFNASEPLDVKNRWVTFDLKGVTENKILISPVAIMIIQLFTRKLERSKGRRSRLWIDEAFDFFKSPVMSNYIGGAYRKIRKEEGQIFLIVQDYKYLAELPSGILNSILQNSPIKIILNHTEGINSELMQEQLGLKKSEINLLFNQTSSHPDKHRILFIKYGTMHAYLARIELSKETVATYQTNRIDVETIEKIADENGGKLENAIEEFVKLKNQNNV